VVVLNTSRELVTAYAGRTMGKDIGKSTHNFFFETTKRRVVIDEKRKLKCIVMKVRYICSAKIISHLATTPQ
jgi:hypothetical protein